MGLVGLPAFIPDWTLPEGVRALQTECGVGGEPYGGFNLGDHVGDDPAVIDAHRQRLTRHTGSMPVWLRQVHGVRVVNLDRSVSGDHPEADAAISGQPRVACAIMTADCLPVLVADRRARVVGAAHAGWRGLAAGVIEALVDAMTRLPGITPGDLTVWLGPAIGPTAFEVGQDVVDAFTGIDPGSRSCFVAQPQAPGKYLADLAALALRRLHKLGIDDVTASGLCTVSAPERFYSYRQRALTGRMASLIWLA